ncbi:hypothetical protein KC325_g85 [Hortaea werneckii]|nr:hypothetical protein KC325_g85 [Hortaea werneckii]
MARPDADQVAAQASGRSQREARQMRRRAVTIPNGREPGRECGFDVDPGRLSAVPHDLEVASRGDGNRNRGKVKGAIGRSLPPVTPRYATARPTDLSANYRHFGAIQCCVYTILPLQHPFCLTPRDETSPICFLIHCIHGRYPPRRTALWCATHPNPAVSRTRALAFWAPPAYVVLYPRNGTCAGLAGQ